jgi:hypothetical protein
MRRAARAPLLFAVLCCGAFASAAPRPGLSSPAKTPSPAPIAEVPAESHAGPRVTFVAVALDAPAERALTSLWLVGEQAVGRSPRFDFVPVTDALDPAGAKSRAAKLAEAESAFAQGL